MWAEGSFYAGTSNDGVLTRRPDGTWASMDDGPYTPDYLTDLAVVNGLLLASGDDSLWWLSHELSTWVRIAGSGNDRMAVADDTVMILNLKCIPTASPFSLCASLLTVSSPVTSRPGRLRFTDLPHIRPSVHLVRSGAKITVTVPGTALLLLRAV